jgi:hypothetical protein
VPIDPEASSEEEIQSRKSAKIGSGNFFFFSVPEAHHSGAIFSFSMTLGSGFGLFELVGFVNFRGSTEEMLDSASPLGRFGRFETSHAMLPKIPPTKITQTDWQTINFSLVGLLEQEDI